MKMRLIRAGILTAAAAVLLSSCSTGPVSRLVTTYEPEEQEIGTAEIDWSTTAQELPYEDSRRIEVTLPRGGSEYSVWGTDIYTGDSSIGTAAVHAGLITFSGGGTVTLQLLPGEEHYDGTERNGVSTLEYGAWGDSFTFVDEEGRLMYSVIREEDLPKEQRDVLGVEEVSWDYSVDGNWEQIGQVMKFRLPPDGTPYAVWGSEVYTADSSIGTAAVHAGLLTLAAGGVVTIQIVDGEREHTGSTRNGITSSSYGTWSASFIFLRE